MEMNNNLHSLECLVHNILEVLTISTMRKKKKIGIEKVKKVFRRISEGVKIEESTNMKMELFIRVNGRERKDMDLEYKCGLMELSIKVIGKIIKHMAKVHSGMYMVTNTKENGKMIKLMVMENTLTVMEQLTKEIGNMIYSMVKEQNSGMMAQDIKDNIKEDKNTEWVFISGKMDLNIKENGF